MAGCGNQTLITILEQLRRQSMRYEFAYARSDAEKDTVFDQHDRIVAHIKVGEGEACGLLNRHLLDSIHPVLGWLRSRQG